MKKNLLYSFIALLFVCISAQARKPKNVIAAKSVGYIVRVGDIFAKYALRNAGITRNVLIGFGRTNYYVDPFVQ